MKVLNRKDAQRRLGWTDDQMWNLIGDAEYEMGIQGRSDEDYCYEERDFSADFACLKKAVWSYGEDGDPEMETEEAVYWLFNVDIDGRTAYQRVEFFTLNEQLREIEKKPSPRYKVLLEAVDRETGARETLKQSEFDDKLAAVEFYEDIETTDEYRYRRAEEKRQSYIQKTFVARADGDDEWTLIQSETAGKHNGENSYRAYEMKWRDEITLMSVEIKDGVITLRKKVPDYNESLDDVELGDTDRDYDWTDCDITDDEYDALFETFAVVAEKTKEDE